MVIYPDGKCGVRKFRHMVTREIDGTPVFDCDGNCGCRGCFTGDITYVIGGFMMTFDGLQCPCEGGSGDDPAGEGDGYGEDDGPYVGGASATFSKSAVIFEDGYWNTPGN